MYFIYLEHNIPLAVTQRPFREIIGNRKNIQEKKKERKYIYGNHIYLKLLKSLPSALRKNLL